MRDVNKVILLGRLGADPTRKTLASGALLVSFSIATGRRYYEEPKESGEEPKAEGEPAPRGELKEDTEWHRIVCWGRQGDACAQYLKKGSRVFVEGTLRTRKWDDEAGGKRSMTEIVAENVSFLGGSSGNNQSAA